MESQTIINIVFAACGAMASWILNRLWESVGHLQEQDSKLADKVQAIELLVAGRYVQRTELTDLGARLLERLDRIENKLDGKVDK